MLWAGEEKANMSASDASTLSPTHEVEALGLGVGDKADESDVSPSSSFTKSPYTDPTILTLSVGPAKTPFHIHRTILAQSPILTAKPLLKLWGSADKSSSTLALPDLDDATAHTLVHYLYTGRYEPLEESGSTTGSAPALASYKLSTSVYSAATRYALPVLASLARTRITALSPQLSIFEILGVARDSAFPVLPAEETWFAGYLEGVIREAVRRDRGVVLGEQFVAQIEGDRRFRGVVMRAVVGCYGGGDGDVDAEDRRKDSEVEGDAEKTENDVQTVQLASVNGVEGEHTHTVQLSAIEPTDLPSPRAPEPATDDLDFTRSKVYQSMGHRSPSNPSIVIANGSSVKPQHVRNDSVVQIDEADSASAASEEKKDEEKDGGGGDAVSEVASPGTTATGKKTKRSKKKKGGGTGFA